MPSSSSAAAAVRTRRQGAVLVATISNPPVNAISAEVRKGLPSALPMVATGIAVVLFALSFVVLAGSIALPNITRGVSWSEAAPAIIGGAVCSLLSIALVVGGVVWILLARRAKPR